MLFIKFFFLFQEAIIAIKAQVITSPIQDMDPSRPALPVLAGVPIPPTVDGVKPKDMEEAARLEVAAAPEEVMEDPKVYPEEIAIRIMKISPWNPFLWCLAMNIVNELKRCFLYTGSFKSILFLKIDFLCTLINLTYKVF